MDDNKLYKTISAIDDDLILDIETLSDIDIDIQSIHDKAMNKLEEHNKKGMAKPRERRLFNKKVYLLVAAISIIFVSSTFADEIQEFFKGLSSKTSIDNTVVQGDAYSLDAPIDINESVTLDKVVMYKDSLTIELRSDKSLDYFDDIKILTPGDDNDQYVSGGYSHEGNEYLFSFYNEVTNDYSITPVPDISLYIQGVKYPIKLAQGKKYDMSDTIFVSTQGSSQDSSGDKISEALTKITIGASFENKDGKNYIRLIPDFSDTGYSLMDMSPLLNHYDYFVEHAKLEDSIVTTSGPLLDDYSIPPNTTLTLKGDSNTEYIAEKVYGRGPSTLFELQKAIDEKSILSIPSILVSSKVSDSLELSVPNIDEDMSVDKIMDFGYQSVKLKKIKRVSSDVIELSFDLNTVKNNGVYISDFNYDIKGSSKSYIEFHKDSATATVTLDKDRDELVLDIYGVYLLLEGNWSIPLEPGK